MPLTDDIKQRLNIVDVVSDYVRLEKLHTRSPEAVCPFHEEQTPSFKLNLERDSWRCFGACSVGGNIFDFVMRIENIGFGEALDKLSAKAGVERRRRDSNESEKRTVPASDLQAVIKVNQLAADYWGKQLRGETGSTAREHLAGRGIGDDVAQRWGLGFAPAGSDNLLHYLRSVGGDPKAVKAAGLLTNSDARGWRDMFASRITFALRDRRGNTLGFAGRTLGDSDVKYLNTSETDHFRKSSIVYGLDKAADAITATGRAVIVEGYMDVIAAHEFGFRNVVACMGTALTSEQLGAIASVLADAGGANREIVLCLDNDEAGQRATLNSLGNAMSQLGGSGATRTHGDQERRADSIRIRVAKPVDSADGPPKDPDEAIRQDPNAWFTSIEDALEGYQFVVESHVSQGKYDEALAAVEPLLGDLPPSTRTGKLRINWIAERVDLDPASLEGILVSIRAKRGPLNSGQRNNGYSSPTHRQGAKATANVTRDVLAYQAAEFELVACLVQDETALDYAGSLDPAHFDSEKLGEIAKLRKSCATPDNMRDLLADDDELVDLYDSLCRHHILLPDDEDTDGSTAIMSIVNACARRVYEEHLRRKVRREGDEFNRPELKNDRDGLNGHAQTIQQTYRDLGVVTAI